LMDAPPNALAHAQRIPGFLPERKRVNSGAARWCTTANPTVEVEMVCTCGLVGEAEQDRGHDSLGVCG
jgi:hypothetical protein